jgi:eukaryotic-like serine/threonine-protein kinase
MDDTKPPTLVDLPPGSWRESEPAHPQARYTLGEVIGKGGWGEVVSARDEQIGRTVAIKRLRGEKVEGSTTIARFLREARVQGRLEHPAIVPVHELGFDNAGQPFFVMKQLAGVTMSAVLARKPGEASAVPELSRQRLLRAFVDVCLAIEFAHTRGVIHRDLKPANIMLGDFGETFVLDWGIALIQAAPDDPVMAAHADLSDSVETNVGAVLGTPGYIAPEQVKKEVAIDGRADVYALGCILFEILAGQALILPGPARLAQALVKHESRPSVRAPDREIPPELDAICVRATALDRDQRFSTARELGEAVRRFLDGDRDLGLRQGLAVEALAAAHDALAAGGTDGRREAIRHAARALALDPTAQDAAVLVGRLMLEPPADVPAEVDADLRARDLDEMRWAARFSVMAAVAYAAFLPLMYWVGIRPLWLYIAIPLLVVGVIVTERLVVKRNPFVSGYLSLACQLGLLACIILSTGAFLIGPAPACIIIMVIANQPLLVSTWLVAAVAAAITLLPAILATTGAIPPVISTNDAVVGVRMVASDTDPTASIITLVIYAVALIALATAMARSQDDERRSARRTLAVQAWQLRQLLPRAA